jgi:glutathione-regulated potassium-efflux system ancillary protein KefF
MIVIIYGHPYPRHSRTNKALLGAVHDLPDVRVRMLYELYPDFSIDVASEQEALAAADLIVWQHPMQWYGVPALMKLWIDKVLAHGWAYGHHGTALRGKHCLWTVTTGGDVASFPPNGAAGFDALAAPLRNTVTYCGMQWAEPFPVHGARNIDDARLSDTASRYREHLADWQRIASART